MNELMIYLLKVSAAIALVTLPYFLALRNDANLVVKRIYLVTGILLSWIFPLLSVRKPGIIASIDPVFLVDPGLPATATATAGAEAVQTGLSTGNILVFLYLAGIIAFFILNIIALTRIRSRVRRSSGTKNIFLTNSEKVFTIYPNIFLPEKYASSAENDAILIHERAHIRQLHMADLLISELSLALTWFNPFSWLISRMIKENHEHLADREVLSQGVRPAHYKSLLLNHALGGEVFRLGHQFNHSLTKKRFNMMKKMKAKKNGILKYILFVPMVLAFTLMATAAGQQSRTIEGKVYLETTDVPATGASVLIAGTPMGTVVDKKGTFALEVTGNPDIVISFVGYETAWVSAREIERKPVVLVPASYEIDLDEKPRKVTENVDVKIIKEEIITNGTPKKVKVEIRSDDGSEPVYVVDGKVVKSIDDIDPEEIQQIKVIKDTDNEIMKKYDTDNGVIMITLKEESVDQKDRKDRKKKAADHEVTEKEVKVVRVKVEEIERENEQEPGSEIEKEIEIEIDVDVDADVDSDSDVEEEVFFVVEDMPMFPGGREALGAYIDSHLEYPAEASRKKMAGKVMVEFRVQTDGSLEDIRVAQSSNDIFNQAALDVFRHMPAWNPGKQRGKAVSCKVIVPVRFTPAEE